MTPTRRTLLAAAAVAPVAATLAAPRLAKGQGALTRVRFVLDWAFQGPQAVYLLGLDRGHFREEGLDVAIDRGFGSGDTPVKLAGGAYDVGIADLSPAIRLRLTQPTSDIVTTLVIAQASPLAAMTLRRTGIRAPKDLEGKRVAAPETDSGRQLFPAFARATGVDASKINWVTVTPQLREPMLARGEAEAITGFETSGIFSLRAVNVRAEDILSMRYADHGVVLLSTALMARRPYAEANPRVMAGMARAIARCHAEALRDPDAAIAALMRRDPTAPAALEKERLVANMEFIRTPDVARDGLGALPMERVQAAIETVRTAFGIENGLAASDLYLPGMLPPAEGLRLA